MAYAADLITVLNSLFGKVTQPSSSEAPKATKRALTEVYQAYETSDTRRDIYRRISADFRQKLQIPGRDEEDFRRLLLQSLGSDPVSSPNLESTGAALSSPSPGVASSSSPVTRVAQQQPGSTVISRKSVEEPTTEPNPNVWSRFIGCLTHPC